jgi:hypothetical protein
VRFEGREECFYGRGLKWIRLNDVDSRLKLLFMHGRMFGVLLRTI